jgi:hypothetical protein
MDLLFRIVYAAHANGTHHKIALDSLKHLANTEAEAWRRLFLKYVDLYLEGSKAPDDQFKDFKNHVLHVRDDYWGGAPEKARNWYTHVVEALTRGDWPQAVYAAGILSHYYSDPVMPFHTAQSEAENAIHRAAEWSINRSYDDLRSEGERHFSSILIMKPEGAHWLEDLVIQGAERSNPYYEKLLAHYDIHAGVVDPPSGLDNTARKIIGELLVYASQGFALILDEAIAESKARAPEVRLTVETVLAALKTPLKFVQKKLADAADRRIVEAMYDELQATGKVDRTLPDDDRCVRDLFAAEVLAPRASQRTAERRQRLPGGTHFKAKRPPRDAAIPPAASAHYLTPPNTAKAEERTHVPTAEEMHSPPELSSLRIQRARTLTDADDIIDAPSIGPRMAERLSAFGMRTIGNLLEADAHSVAMKLGDRRVSEATIRDWQDQTRLVMTIPGLRGGHAQLLVGAGFRTLDAIGATDPDKLCADILAFASTIEGQRILRDSNAPDIERIKGWADHARATRAA